MSSLVAARPGRGGLLCAVAHHGLMLLAMLPCFVPVPNAGVAHAVGLVVLALLALVTARRARHAPALLPLLLDDLVMVALAIAGLLGGHASGGHHGGGSGAVSLGQGVAVAAIAGWALCRAALRGRRTISRDDLGLGLVLGMVIAMVPAAVA